MWTTQAIHRAAYSGYAQEVEQLLQQDARCLNEPVRRKTMVMHRNSNKPS